MAAPAEGQLVAVIADEVCRRLARLATLLGVPRAYPEARLQDTITGFLLAGVGNVDVRRKTNFLIVDSSRQCCYLRLAAHSALFAQPRASLSSETTTRQIESTFKEFTSRDDIAIVLISQNVANMIRNVVDQHHKVGRACTGSGKARVLLVLRWTACI